jgi:hypothetical protein
VVSFAAGLANLDVVIGDSAGSGRSCEGPAAEEGRFDIISIVDADPFNAAMSTCRFCRTGVTNCTGAVWV